MSTAGTREVVHYWQQDRGNSPRELTTMRAHFQQPADQIILTVP